MQKYTIADGIEEFLTQIVAIPPGNCNTETRWQPRDEKELVGYFLNSKKAVGIDFFWYF